MTRVTARKLKALKSARTELFKKVKQGINVGDLLKEIDSKIIYYGLEKSNKKTMNWKS